MLVLRTIRTRLTLWYVVLLAVILAAFCAGIYFALREALHSNLDESLESRAAIVREVVTQDGNLQITGVDIPGDPIEGEEFTRIHDASGDVVYDNSPERFRTQPDVDAVAEALAGSASERNVDNGAAELRVLTAPLYANAEIVGVVEVGLENEAGETLSTLLLIIAIAYPATLLVASAVGVFLSGRALGPIDRITQTARRIGAEDLGKRLDLPASDDEVGRLARTFNEMIARLDDAFRRQRQFTADASHELRTPLTSIKGQTEVALQRERSPDEYREVLAAVNSEVDRMIRLVGSLLTLARADARRIEIVREELGVDALISDAAEQVRPAAENQNLTLRVEAGDGASVIADQDLILQLLLNLLDNAVKYTPSGGRIDVRYRRLDGEVEIIVADTGAGIAPEHLPHIFDRFYRVDAARSRAEGGSGLGLAICRWIAEAHGGTITVESEPGAGTTFTVTLPAK